MSFKVKRDDRDQVDATGTRRIKTKRADFDSVWDKLKETVEMVLQSVPVPNEVWKESFDYIYTLCDIHREPKKLYQKTKQYLDDHVNTLLNELNSKEEDEKLAFYYQKWQEYRKGIDYLNKLYQ